MERNKTEHGGRTFSASLRGAEQGQCHNYVRSTIARAPKHRIYMYFFQRSGWYCQFLKEDLKTSLPKTTTLDDPDRLFEIAERGGYLMNLEGRQAIEHAIENGRGGVCLQLTDEQYQKLRKMNTKSERATSLAGCRPL